MKKYEVEIVGVTPYMQHRMDDLSLDEWEKKRGLIIERNDVAQEDLKKAEYHMYIDEYGKPYIPAEQIRGSMINAGGFIKAKVGNAKKSMRNIIAAMFFIEPNNIPLKEEWTLDKRSAVNKNIKARVITVRPKWEKWTAKFNLVVDNDTITDETANEVLNYAGQYCGIGSFRPTNNGMFGRFKVTTFKKVMQK